MMVPSDEKPETTPAWSPDCGDEMYRNPVLFADYSDPDVVRVGDDFWLTASSFSHVPGLPILHSRDLVNWTLVNHALPRLGPEAHFAQPRHGGGVWAPAIRHHAGLFWIFYPDPDFGLYVITAADPRGAWSAPVMVKAGKGLIDPCPFWDEDGSGYLVHGWARSRSGISNRLTLHRLTPDSRGVADAGVTVIDGDTMPGWHTIEGPKLYRHSGYYYIFAPAGGVTQGYQAVFRARTITGPYEARIVLAQGSTAINGPHQGAWVDTAAGEHWFLHFQERPAFGRIVHLQPMRWDRDGWPRMGREGEPVTVHAKPALPSGQPTGPATSDDFAGPAPGRQWQWQANPQPGWVSDSPVHGSLGLNCVPLAPGGGLWTAGHLLLQKFPAPAFTADTAMTLLPAADGDEAGLVVFGYDYAWLGLRREQGETRLVLVTCPKADAGGMETTQTLRAAPAGEIQLRVAIDADARCHFAYAVDGRPWVAVDRVFQARSSKWVGAKVGLFAATTAPAASGGWAKFGRFTIAAGAAR